MARLADAAGRGSLVAIDTVAFVYRLELDPRRSSILEEFFSDVEHGYVRGVASVVAVLEILVRPLRLGQPTVASDYQDFFMSYPNLTIRDVTLAVARRAAEIRARHNLAIGDSMHLATAVESGADCFLTNDRQLSRFRELPVLIIDDFIDDQNGTIGSL